MAQIRPLALELPYAADAALKWKKKKSELVGQAAYSFSRPFGCGEEEIQQCLKLSEEINTFRRTRHYL